MRCPTDLMSLAIMEGRFAASCLNKQPPTPPNPLWWRTILGRLPKGIPDVPFTIIFPTTLDSTQPQSA